MAALKADKVRSISIHAPARGATKVFFPSAQPLKYFNPRTREGCDRFLLILKTRAVYFNPRTREGCDVYMYDDKPDERDFNPRTREGCDCIFKPFSGFFSYS